MVAAIFQQTNGGEASFLEIVENTVLTLHRTVSIPILPQLPLVVQVTVAVAASKQHKHQHRYNQKDPFSSHLHVIHILNKSTNVRGTIKPDATLVVKFN